MRYEDLDLAIGGTALHLHFNPRLTVLAGLPASQRTHLIDSISGIHAGTIPDAHLSVVDMNGRPRIIDARSPPAGPPRTPAQWAASLGMGAADLGLPDGDPDPDRPGDGAGLESTLIDAAETRQQISAAEATLADHARLRAALADAEARLAAVASPDGRRQRDRSRTSTELRVVRAQIEATTASAAEIARDEHLSATAREPERLASSWAELADELDALRVQLRDHRWLEPDEVDELADIPDTIPEDLAKAIEARDTLRGEIDSLRARLDHERDHPSDEIPKDPRVLTLALVDQDTLWMAHRALVMATDALEAAQREEEANVEDGEEWSERLERLHRATVDAATAAERRWLPAVLIATIAVCIAALVPAAGFAISLAIAPLVVAVAAIVFGTALPRVRVRRARRAEQDGLAHTGVDDIAAYRARMDVQPGSERWQRAERIINDYQMAYAEWYELVGTVTPTEATEVEQAVAAWVEQMNASGHRETAADMERSIEKAEEKLTETNRELADALAAYDLEPDIENLTDALADKTAEATIARLQRALVATEQAEAEVTGELESELAALGFTDGGLRERLVAYAGELGAAQRRIQLRRTAPPADELEAHRIRLESRLRRIPPPSSSALPDPGDESTSELRRHRDELRARVEALVDPDIAALRGRLARTERRIDGTSDDAGRALEGMIEEPRDHLVDLLVRYRPDTTDPGDEPLPVLLDDPFHATPTNLKHQLLDALIEVSELVQVILLTDDDDVVEWAHGQLPHEHVELLAPGTHTLV